MTAFETLALTAKLVAISLMIQSGELLYLRKEFQTGGLWPWSILKKDFPPMIGSLLSFILSSPYFLILIIVQMVMSAVLFINPTIWICAGLFFTALMINVRFRGTFNGGSDKMTMMSLIALMIATSHNQNQFYCIAGLGFLALQTVTSYFLAGFVKFRMPSWRNGQVLPTFLRLPQYPIPQKLRQLGVQNPKRLQTFSKLLLGFECLFPLVFLNYHLAIIFFAVACIFHLVNIWIFGLNRFFFAWIATYPAILFFIRK